MNPARSAVGRRAICAAAPRENYEGTDRIVNEEAVTPEGMTAIRIFVDDEHTLRVDGDAIQTIIIEKSE